MALRTSFRISRPQARLMCKRSESWWSQVETGPTDAIFGVTEAWKADSNPKKVLLGVGAYRTDEGTPFILPSVQRAKEIIERKKLDHEYLPQGGFSDFNRQAARLALGEDSCIIDNGLNLTVQGLGGTGAIRLGMAFLSRFYPGCKVIYIPDPTWVNHRTIAAYSGLQWKSYRYYDPDCISVDFYGMCDDLKEAPERSIVIFQALAHNPTGLDPTLEQWKELSQICKEKNLFVFFDLAYQGFATGDTDQDAQSVRLFIDDGHKVALAQSFSKNMGLYGERIGALTLIMSSKEELAKVNSQMKIVIRAMYSNPPLYGARIVNYVLSEKALRCQWLKDIKAMSIRIKCARQMLVENLAKEGSQRDWGHIVKQLGMFSYTGLTSEQVALMAKKYSIYLTSNGRISIASIGSKNVQYVAKAIHDVTK